MRIFFAATAATLALALIPSLSMADEAKTFEDLFAPLTHGGCVKVDKVRAVGATVDLTPEQFQFVRAFCEQGKPVGAICHAPWTLIEAGVVRGRTLTSFPSLQTDIRNAGGKWVDREVVVDNGLVTSRKPDDIPAFNKKLIEEFAEGRHEQQAAKTKATTS